MIRMNISLVPMSTFLAPCLFSPSPMDLGSSFTSLAFLFKVVKLNYLPRFPLVTSVFDTSHLACLSLRRLLVRLWGRTSDPIVKLQLHLSHTCQEHSLFGTAWFCYVPSCPSLARRHAPENMIRSLGAGTRFWLLVSNDHKAGPSVPASHS